MAFDPTGDEYVVDFDEKCMPVVLLLDVSGSMDGDKIYRLYDAVKTMISTFESHSRKEEIVYKVAIITFGSQVKCHTRYTEAKYLNNLQRFEASGRTPLGTALKMAKDMVEDRDETKSLWYKPAIILVSDGVPTDDWKTPKSDFVDNGRSAKSQRISVAVGNDADEDMLKSFVSKPEFFFKADDASKIVAVFEKVTMSVVSNAVTQKGDAKPNSGKEEKNVTSVKATISRRAQVINDDYEDNRWN